MPNVKGTENRSSDQLSGAGLLARLLRKREETNETAAWVKADPIDPDPPWGLSVPVPSGIFSAAYYTDIAQGARSLTRELAHLRRQMDKVQQEAAAGEQLQQLITTIDRAFERSNDLTARVLLPTAEDMEVRLVPAYSLERLEEYRFDQNIFYLLVGIFGGAIAGIMVHWAISEQFILTRALAVLLGLFFVFTLACIVWAWLIHRRTVRIKKHLLRPNVERLDLPPGQSQPERNGQTF